MNIRNVFIIGLFLFGLFFPLSQVFAARLWSSGCELQGDVGGTPTDNLEFDLATGGASTASISTSIKRSGLSSCQATGGGTGFVEYRHEFITPAAGPYFVRFYLYISSAPSSDLTIATYINAGDARSELVLTSSRTLKLIDADDTTSIATYATPLSTGTWYRIEYQYDNAIDGHEVRIDGSTVMGPIVCTSCANAGEVWFGADNWQTPATGTVYFDDIAVNDSSGGAQNSWPGVGSIVHMQPNASGDNSGCTAGDWSSIDEITPDDASTLCTLTTDGGGNIVDTNVESYSAAGIDRYDTISLVQVGVRDAAASAASEGWQLRIKSASSGSVSSGTATTHDDTTYTTNGDLGVQPNNYTLTSYTDPTTAVAWTPTGTNSLENMQIGMISTDGNPDINLSALWALVEYVDVYPPQARSAWRNMRMKLNGGRYFQR